MLTLTRRDALRAAGGALFASSFFGMLAGCGGGGSKGGSKGEAIRRRIATGSVATSELGGENHQAVTAYGGSMAGDGTFSVEASDEGAQLLTVIDSANVPRGMAIAIPGATLTVDAASTATAVLFLTPGLSTSDTTEATSLIGRIQASADYAAFLACARTLLPLGGMPALAADAEAEALKANIVDSLSESVRSRGQEANNSQIAFFGEWGDGPARIQQVSFQNGSYRYVRLDEVKLGPERQRLARAQVKDSKGVPITAMPSVNLLTVGNWALGQTGNPSTATGKTNLQDPTNTRTYKVYVSGPGTGLVGEQSDLSLVYEDVREAWEKTALNLVLYPFMDLLLGAGNFAKKVGKTLAEITGLLYGKFQTALSGISAYSAAMSGDLDGLCSALLDGLVGIVGIGAAIFGFLFGGTIAGAIGIALAAVAAGMSARNLVVAGRTFLRYPSTQSIELDLAVGQVTVK